MLLAIVHYNRPLRSNHLRFELVILVDEARMSHKYVWGLGEETGFFKFDRYSHSNSTIYILIFKFNMLQSNHGNP